MLHDYRVYIDILRVQSHKYAYWPHINVCVHICAYVLQTTDKEQRGKGIACPLFTPLELIPVAHDWPGMIDGRMDASGVYLDQHQQLMQRQIPNLGKLFHMQFEYFPLISFIMARKFSVLLNNDISYCCRVIMYVETWHVTAYVIVGPICVVVYVTLLYWCKRDSVYFCLAIDSIVVVL